MSQSNSVERHNNSESHHQHAFEASDISNSNKKELGISHKSQSHHSRELDIAAYECASISSQSDHEYCDSMNSCRNDSDIHNLVHKHSTPGHSASNLQQKFPDIIEWTTGENSVCESEFNSNMNVTRVNKKETDCKQKNKTRALEAALLELESIYKSLCLEDEDLLDRAEKRSMDEFWNRQNQNFAENNVFVEREELDRSKDDMAYRRMHPSKSTSSRLNASLPNISYLMSSPVLNRRDMEYVWAEASLLEDERRSKKSEPDIIRDDIVFRNITYANNLHKILEPQPPFGIPLGPITSATESDYLHVEPPKVTRPRSRYVPRCEPDIVTDDLAYRTLRKDVKEDMNRSPSQSPNLVLNTAKLYRAEKSLSPQFYKLVNPLLKRNRNSSGSFRKSTYAVPEPDSVTEIKREKQVNQHQIFSNAEALDLGNKNCLENQLHNITLLDMQASRLQDNRTREIDRENSESFAISPSQVTPKSSTLHLLSSDLNPTCSRTSTFAEKMHDAAKFSGEDLLNCVQLYDDMEKLTLPPQPSVETKYQVDDNWCRDLKGQNRCYSKLHTTLGSLNQEKTSNNEKLESIRIASSATNDNYENPDDGKLSTNSTPVTHIPVNSKFTDLSETTTKSSEGITMVKEPGKVVESGPSRSKSDTGERNNCSLALRSSYEGIPDPSQYIHAIEDVLLFITNNAFVYFIVMLAFLIALLLTIINEP